MRLRSHITSLKKLASGLSYLVVLLCLFAFAGQAVYMPIQPTAPSRTELVISAYQQVHKKTLSWQRAVSILGGSKHSAERSKINLIQLSRLHDRLSKAAYDYLSRQFVIGLHPGCFAALKTIPQSSDELPHSLSIV